MPVNNPFLQPVRSAVDYANDYARADALRNTNALQALTLDQATQSNAAKGGIRNALAALGPDAGLDKQIGTLRSLGTPEALQQADTLDTASQNRLKTAAQAAKDNADAGKTTQETRIVAHQKHLESLASVSTPEEAVQWMLQGVQSGALPREGLEQGLQKLQAAAANPQTFAAWKQGVAQSGMTIQQQMEMTTAKPTEVRLGNVVRFFDTNPHSATYGKEVTPAQPIGVSPDTVATQAGENSRAAASRATQLRLGGYDANGNLLDLGLGGPAAAPTPASAPAKPGAAPAASPLAGLVDSIGTYKSPESVALARVPPALKSQVLAAVMQRYPDYDPSTFGAKQKAARDFGTGQQGNAMRSFAVAGQHLDQLAPLIDALANGDNKTVNQVGNAIATWNGATPVTNFDAAKEVVGKEVIKAIVGSGGGVDERQELARQLDAAKSPEQLRGVIKQYRNLMSAQHDALHAQRLGAGLPDSTLPNYGDAGTAASAAGSGWKILGVH